MSHAKAGKWEKKKFEGRELAGKTLAVIGLGNIGRIVADRAHGLKMNVIGFDPVMTAERAAALGVELCPLDAIWPRADAVSVHTPLTAETRGIVNSSMLGQPEEGRPPRQLRPRRHLRRGGPPRRAEQRHIGGVALDVFVEEPPPKDHPLVAHERVIVTPHLGASTRRPRTGSRSRIAEQVVAVPGDGGHQERRQRALGVGRDRLQARPLRGAGRPARPLPRAR